MLLAELAMVIIKASPPNYLRLARRPDAPQLIVGSLTSFLIQLALPVAHFEVEFPTETIDFGQIMVHPSLLAI